MTYTNLACQVYPKACCGSTSWGYTRNSEASSESECLCHLATRSIAPQYSYTTMACRDTHMAQACSHPPTSASKHKKSVTSCLAPPGCQYYLLDKKFQYDWVVHQAEIQLAAANPKKFYAISSTLWLLKVVFSKFYRLWKWACPLLIKLFDSYQHDLE